jgi:raffinose/stachyose/melibiose transport system substrate-binding protein
MGRKATAGALAAALVLAVAGCGDDRSSDSGGEPSGEITVLTQRTDIVNTVFQDYRKKFQAKYPKVKVKFEAITDYEGEVKIRMNTKDYGDVLLIPNLVSADQLPTFFEPLGDVETMKSKYRFVTSEQNYNGKVYGLAITGNAQGFVYNKKIWTQAGITTLPKTPGEFLTDLKTIKDKVPGTTPLYTNYKDGWPLTQWEGARGGVSGDPDTINKLVKDDAPWAAGKEHYIIDSLLWDVVDQGLTEADPTTTAWEPSKGLIGTGKVATMMLGSWAIVQMQAAAPSKSDISYLPFPVQVGGKFHATIGGDYKNAVNINSKHKAAAKAWVTWFADESNYATDQGGVSPLLSGTFPETLADFKANGVELIELNPAPKGEEGLADRIDKAAEIGLWEPKYRQALVDAARGAKKQSKEDVFNDLNKKWAAARKNTK